MGSFFYKLGRLAGPKVRKGKWVWNAVAGSESDVIDAEREVGRDLAEGVRREKPRPADADRFAPPLQRLAADLAARLRDDRREFTIDLVDDEPPNAFALPGGYIFLSSGLIRFCDRMEDELAFVIAHEMAHIIRGHAIERLLATSAAKLLTRTTTRGALAGWVSRAGTTAIERAYSRDQELDADGFAVRLLRAAGLDPAAATRLLERFETLSSDTPGSTGTPGSSDSGSPGPPESWFATHPAPADRIKAIQKALRSEA